MSKRIFTTRPELSGTLGMVSSSHWLSSTVGMAVLEDNGNAFDAAVAAGFVLQVVEPHLHGPAGEVSAIFSAAADPGPRVLCGQGVAPAAATVGHFREELGLRTMPSTGLLAATVPGAWDAWLLLLRDYGTKSLRDVLKYAIGYARNGFPMVARTIDKVEGLFRNHWPTSAAIWLPDGRVPELGALFRNPTVARTWERLLGEAEAAGSGREEQIEAGRRAWSNGFVAEAIDSFCRIPVRDDTGRNHAGLLTGDDIGGWNATFEEAVVTDLSGLADGHSLAKCGFWSQGPVLAQQLKLLAGFADRLSFVQSDGRNDHQRLPTVDTVHLVIECAKLAFADREAWYGDVSDVPVDVLLSDQYAAERRLLISDDASMELRPGSLNGLQPRISKSITPGRTVSGATSSAVGISPEGVTRGDTVHIDVVDKWGNMVSATPSGGWLQSSPVIPSLGFSLGVRAEMFLLEDGLPNSLGPGKRPRTTLSPSLGLFDGVPTMAFGTPGGDQQDQWQLCFWLAHIVGRMKLQAASDAPVWHTTAFPSSYNPRSWDPGRVVMESRLGDAVRVGLVERGHDVVVGEPWGDARQLVVSRDPVAGLLRAGASARGTKAYAVGR